MDRDANAEADSILGLGQKGRVIGDLPALLLLAARCSLLLLPHYYRLSRVCDKKEASCQVI
jgi:hypothetical protein